MLSAVAFVALCGLAKKTPTAKPNIIFFMADDTGWNNVGWHNPDMKTPHANALVKEGLELDRHYAFVYCSPSRSSFMTGRLPFHVQQTNYPNVNLGQGAPRNMTFIAAKMKAAGYQTAHAGKWHLGMSSWGHIPLGRGFDQSLVYFEGAEDHWTQRSCQDPLCIVPINASTPGEGTNGTSPFDLWRNDAPAHDVAGTRYNGYQFNDFALDVIRNHNADKGPLFMYLAPANSHTPLEAPQRFLDLYPADWYLDRRQYAAACSFWDEILGNVTAALKARNMWDNTLLVFSSDNGGPVYWSMTPSFPHGAGANNWPLLGGKVSNWEGGTRVAAFVAGGFLPPQMRGHKLEEHVHMCDWYATFCALAGVSPVDTEAAKHGLPPVDSLNMWPLLSGAATHSPRSEIPLAVDFETGTHVGKILGNSSALIIGAWKLLAGTQLQTYHQGPDFPNASLYGELGTHLKHCGDSVAANGCLFNIMDDPTEQHNQAAAQPQRWQSMMQRLGELRKSRFQQPSDVSQKEQYLAQITKNGNFCGPWLP